MLAKYENFGDVVKYFLTTFCITCSVCSVGVYSQEGNGCGHTLLGPESGTIASQNYPGTYPSNTWCKWTLRVSQGRMMRLTFGDFDIEGGPGCSNGSFVLTGKNGAVTMGPVCGKLDESQKNLFLQSNEVTVNFRTGSHRTGRGFLLSYTTDQNPDIISCLHKGSHFNFQHLSFYCPAGCKDVPGDVWGNSEQGYRDTSVLCKSAVHAGATSDSSGGRITVNRERSLTFYESTFANGILSKTGSLSEKKLLFSKECNNVLAVSGLNASSFWDKSGQEHRMFSSFRNMEPSHDFQHWTADSSDLQPWLEMELAEKSTVTGVLTTGSVDNYIKSYSLHFSKDRKNWKPFRSVLSKEQKIFEASTDGHFRVLNSLFPGVVTRFVRLQPLNWHKRASLQVKVLGCPTVKVTPRSRPPAESPSSKVIPSTSGPSPAPTEESVLVETTQSSSQPAIAAVGVVLGLIMCGSCLLAGILWRRRYKKSQMKTSLPIDCQSFKAKTPQSELICYPLERNVHDALPCPPVNDYAAPALADVGQKVGSTFRPSSDEGYTTPFPCPHYDTPGVLPEYAEPLPPEPEYATPFTELDLPALGGIHHGHVHRAYGPASSVGVWTTPGHSQYDCPSHRVLSNGYCTPALHTTDPQLDSGLYAEPTSSDSLLQKHTYEEPL